MVEDAGDRRYLWSILVIVDFGRPLAVGENPCPVLSKRYVENAKPVSRIDLILDSFRDFSYRTPAAVFGRHNFELCRDFSLSLAVVPKRAARQTPN